MKKTKSSKNIVFLIILAVLGVAGYMALKPKVATAPEVASEEKSNPLDCKFNDEDTCKFIKAWGKHKDFKASMEIMTDGKLSMTMLMEINEDGDTHTTARDQAGNAIMEAIYIGKDYYMKPAGTTSWIKSTLNESMKETLDNVMFDYNSSENYKITKIGEESCAGVSCTKFQITDIKSPENVSYVWTNREYFPIKMESETSIAGKKSTVKVTYTIGKVKIERPTDITEVPAMPNTSVQSGVMENGELTPEMQEQIQKAIEQYNK